MENLRKRLLNIVDRHAPSSSSEEKSGIIEKETGTELTKSDGEIHEKVYEKVTDEKEIVDESGRKRGKIVHVDRIIIQKRKKVKEKPETHLKTDTTSQQSDVKKTELTSGSTVSSEAQSSTEYIIASNSKSNISLDRNTSTSASTSISDKAVHTGEFSSSSSVSTTDRFSEHSDSVRTSHTSEQSKENLSVSKDEAVVTKYLLKNAAGEERSFEGDPDKLPAGFEIISCVKLIKKQNQILKSTFTSKHIGIKEVTTSSQSTHQPSSATAESFLKECRDGTVTSEIIDSKSLEEMKRVLSQLPNDTDRIEVAQNVPISKLNQSFNLASGETTKNIENLNQEGRNVSEEQHEDIKYILRDSSGKEETFKGNKEDIPAGFEIVKTIRLVTRRRVVEENSVTKIKENTSKRQEVSTNSGCISLNESHFTHENSMSRVPENDTKKIVQAQESSAIISESTIKTCGMLESDSETNVVSESVSKKSLKSDGQESVAAHLTVPEKENEEKPVVCNVIPGLEWEQGEQSKQFPPNNEDKLPEKLIEDISDQLKVVSSGESDDTTKKHTSTKKKNRLSWFNWRQSELIDESKDSHQEEKDKSRREKKKKRWFGKAASESKEKMGIRTKNDSSDLEEGNLMTAETEDCQTESPSEIGMSLPPLDIQEEIQAPLADNTSPNTVPKTAESLFKTKRLEATTNESDTTQEKTGLSTNDHHKVEEKKRKRWLGIPISVSRTLTRNDAGIETVQSSEDDRKDQAESSDKKKKRKKRVKNILPESSENLSSDNIDENASKCSRKEISSIPSDCIHRFDEGTSSGLSSLTIDSLAEEKYHDSLDPRVNVKVEMAPNKRGTKRSSFDENSSDSSHDHRVTKGLSFFKKTGSASISPSSQRKNEADKNSTKGASYDVTPTSSSRGGLKHFFSKVTDFVRSNDVLPSEVVTENDGLITGKKYAPISEAQDLCESKILALNPENRRTVEKIEADGTEPLVESRRLDARKSMSTIKSNSISSVEEFFDSLDGPHEGYVPKDVKTVDVVDYKRSELESQKTDDDLPSFASQSGRTFSTDSIPSYDSDSTSWYPEYKRNQITTTCAYSRKKRPLNKAQYDDRIAVIKG